MIARSAFIALVKTDLRRVCIEAGEERPREYIHVDNVEEMETNPVTDRQITGLGAMPSKPEGDAFSLDQPSLGGVSSVTADPYALAAEITWEMWRDEQYGVMKDFAAHIGRSGRNREEVDGWSPWNNAFDNAFPGFDGVSLCHIAHPFIEGGGTWRNRPSPDIGFSITGIQNMILDFHGLVNERRLTEVMTPVQIILHYQNLFAAREILGSSGKPYTSDQEINALIEENLHYIVSHFLGSATAWFAQARPGVHDVNFGWRDHPLPSAFDDPWTMNGVFAQYQRHKAYFMRARGVWGSTGVGA